MRVQLKQRLALSLTLAALLVAASQPLVARDDVRPGDLLVAAESLTDPNFSRSVVLVVRHGASGTVGLNITRPLDIAPGDVLPEVNGLAAYSGPLFSGGPVMPFGMLALVRSSRNVADAERVAEGIWIGSVAAIEAALDAGSDDAKRLRVYAGHAGWRPGQLAREIADGAWHVTPGDSDIVFAPRPDNIWYDLKPARLLRAYSVEFDALCIQMLRWRIKDSKSQQGPLSWASRLPSRISARPTRTEYAHSATSI